jgi:uncharacterized protein (TIGR02757 family)
MIDEEQKIYFDSLVKKYETIDFIKDDPVQFPHKFIDREDQEISGLIASCLAYGKREMIIQDVEAVHKIMNYKPSDFVKNFDYQKDKKLFLNFKHRFTAGNDVSVLLLLLHQVFMEYNSLENVFLENYSPDDNNIKDALTGFVNILKSFIPPDLTNNSGINYLLPSPEKGSACKRLNLFLKWMVRSAPVDLGLWNNVSKSQLIIPLDTHVAKLSRKFGLVARKADDWITAEEITDKLKSYDINDPVKYDFALFGLGISGDDLRLKSRILK